MMFFKIQLPNFYTIQAIIEYVVLTTTGEYSKSLQIYLFHSGDHSSVKLY